MTKLNLACGDYRLKGFVNLDKRDGWRFEDGLPGYPDGTVEAITVSHGLMYVAEAAWPGLFVELARVLAPGGILRVTEDATDDPASERYRGHWDAVALTSASRVCAAMEAAGLRSYVLGKAETMFRDRSLCQSWHGDSPKVFHAEGVKVGARLTVIVPTIGRPSLERTLRSAEGADEILVDHNQDDDRGYAARERLIARATGTHLAFMDDDDLYTSHGVGLLRDAAAANPERATIFKMRYPQGHELWKHETLMFGNVGTPMFVVPNRVGMLGRWAPQLGSDTGGDFTFIEGCCEKLGAPIWREECVALIRPQ